MKTVTIYLKVVKGQVIYRDSEGHSGPSITTHIGHGSKLAWKLDRCSGITEIESIDLNGDLNILKGKPTKIDYDYWEVFAADKGEGKITCKVNVAKCEECCSSEVEINGDKSDPGSLELKMP